MKGQRGKKRKLRAAREVRRAKAIRTAAVMVSVALVVAMIIDDMLFSATMSETEAKTSEADVIVDNTTTTEIVESEEFIVEPQLEPEIVVESESSELAKIMTNEYYESLDDVSEKLVLVDISEQHVWAFEDEEIVLESPVVTGLKDRYDTQLGVYSVILKRQNYTMRGSYGRVKVGYWMRFNDAYAQGLHDAPWRGSTTFGGDTYVGNGSHGCVNLPLEFTAELYDFVEVGTPVIVQE